MESGKEEGVGKTWQMKEVSARILGRGLRACKTQGRHQPGAQLDMQQVLGSLCAAPVSLCSRSTRPVTLFTFVVLLSCIIFSFFGLCLKKLQPRKPSSYQVSTATHPFCSFTPLHPLLTCCGSLT